jgi:diguanylate cyclase (GGDEF)-like protein
MLIKPGARPPGLCFVDQGSLAVEQDGYRLREFRSGSYFGEGSLFRDEPPEVSIHALEPARLLILPYQPIHRFLAERPAFGVAFTGALVSECMRRLTATNHLYAQNRALALDLETKADALAAANEQLQREAEARRRADAKVARLAALADECPTPIMRADATGRLLYANAPCAPLLAVWRTAVGERVPPALRLDIGAALTERRTHILELNVQDESFLFTTVPVPDGGYVNLYGRDVTTDRRKEQRILHLANHDSLTGLPNRQSFLDRLQQCLDDIAPGEEAAKAGTGDGATAGGSVMFLDLDHFKEVNDTLGHPVGDRLLQAVAQRLVKSMRGTDLVARLGGDEFATIQVGLTDPDRVAEKAQRIIDQVSRPYVIDGHQIRIGVSIGITFFPGDHREVEPLVKNADLAMYRAKSDGRNTFRFYVADLETKLRQRLELEGDMRLALAEEQFVLHYQPKIEIETGLVIGAEALVRWKHPRLGMVPPDHFIPAAERCGLITDLGRWVLATACREAASWQRRGLPRIHVAVNLSPVQIQDPHLVSDVAGLLDETGLDPELLELEITETILMQDVENTITKLDALKALGLGIAIDDFGTGYSCLNYLRRFPVGKIKIDRSFVQDMTSNSGAATITRAIIGLSQSLNMSVVAEGVEDVHQLDQLRAFRCTEGQGYFFSRPLPADGFTAFVSQPAPQVM